MSSSPSGVNSRDGNVPEADVPSPSCRERQSKRERVEETAARREDRNFIYGERDADGELIVLGEAHLAALAQSSLIRAKLRSGELQRLLRLVDSSRSRTDALEAAMANIPEFKQFCDDVLATVARAERDLKPRVG